MIKYEYCIIATWQTRAASAPATPQPQSGRDPKVEAQKRDEA